MQTLRLRTYCCRTETILMFVHKWVLTSGPCSPEAPSSPGDPGGPTPESGAGFPGSPGRPGGPGRPWINQQHC